MSTTTCITIGIAIGFALSRVELKSVARALAGDWGPALHAMARHIGAVLAVPFTLGFMAGVIWHQLVAWAVEHELQGLARLGLPGGNVQAFLTGSAAPDHFVGVNKMLVQRQALALPPARSIGIAPPSIQHLAAEGFSQQRDSMTRAIQMVREENRSQRVAAKACGISRSSLQRALTK
jgi:hypothetical protein